MKRDEIRNSRVIVVEFRGVEGVERDARRGPTEDVGDGELRRVREDSKVHQSSIYELKYSNYI